MYAQKLTTVDRDILSSIHWYVFAIFVLLLGWLNTYVDRSFLVQPVERLKRIVKPHKSTDPPPEPATDLVTTEVADLLLADPPQPIQPLAATAEQTSPPLSDSSPSPRKRLTPLSLLINRLLPTSMDGWWRYSVAFSALLINIYSAQLLRANYYSALGSWGWLLSLAILLLAFVREPKRQIRDLDPHTDIMDETDVHLSRRVEVGIVVAIFLLALGLRMLNLGDWTTGMHGDEGEAGMDAVRILEGNHVSPFQTGWFSQPNFYYWGIALSMKLFGTCLFGLRMFSTLVGALMILPFYPLVKMWFGIRTAIIATLLLAFSDVAIHFSRAEFSNITTPAFLVAGFYFLLPRPPRQAYPGLHFVGLRIHAQHVFLPGRQNHAFPAAGRVRFSCSYCLPILRLPGAYRAHPQARPRRDPRSASDPHRHRPAGAQRHQLLRPDSHLCHSLHLLHLALARLLTWTTRGPSTTHQRKADLLE